MIKNMNIRKENNVFRNARKRAFLLMAVLESSIMLTCASLDRNVKKVDLNKPDVIVKAEELGVKIRKTDSKINKLSKKIEDYCSKYTKQ